MTLRKREDTGIWKRKQQIALSEELALKTAMDLSQGRLRVDEVWTTGIGHWTLLEGIYGREILFITLRINSVKQIEVGTGPSGRAV